MNDPKAPLSLTEILIGVLALGILAAFVVPAMRNAGEASDLIKCRGNLYEIGQATYLYAADNDGRIAPERDHSDWGTFVADRMYGFLLAERHGGLGAVDYIGRPHDLFCPSNHPEYFQLAGVRHPDDIDEDNQIYRMGYMWMYYPGGWSAVGGRSNALISGDPHRVLLFDMGTTAASLSSTFTLPSHSSVLNVLHSGGHVNTVSIEESNVHSSRDELYDWLGDQSRNAHVTPIEN